MKHSLDKCFSFPSVAFFFQIGITARKAEKVEDLALKFPGRAIVAQLDVRKPEETT